MAQTQVPAYYRGYGNTIPCVAVVGTDYVGNVKVLGTIPMVWESIDPYISIGQLSPNGIWNVPKDASTFTPGDPVYWNATGNPNDGTAGTGCATSTASGNVLMGVCVPPTTGVNAVDLTADDYVPVLFTAAKLTATLGGAITADSLTGDASTMPIAGLNSTQGGSVSVTGGASSTSGNAGGAVSLLGGAPGATGVGGAITIAGSIGGATSGAGGAVTIAGGAGTAGNAAGGAASMAGGAGQGTAAGGVLTLVGGAGGGGATGNGGAASLTGGASTSTNGTGGAASLVGGLGTGSGAGGAITITSGAAGATGVAGAVNISVGSATAGAGSSVTITAGNGAGGTAAGGQVNLVPGTAVSTGVPGEVQVNGNSGLIFITEALTATDATRTVYVATRAVRFKAVSVVWTTGSTSGTLQIEKCTGTTAPGSGTTLLTGTVTLAGTGNTVGTGTPIATVASLTLAAGDRLGIVIAGTMTNLVGCRITLAVTPV